MAVIARVLEARISLVLLVLNALVFCYAASLGDTTEVPVLLAAGALERTHVLAGEWWRLGSSMFVHIGIAHLLLNAVGGFGCCAVVEQDLGKAKFLFVYLASGVGGAAISVIVQEETSAGASGAYFGMIGAMLVLRQRELGSWVALLRDPFARHLLLSTVIWIEIAVLFIDMDHGAHAGGFAMGAALCWALTSVAFRARVSRTAVVLATLAALLYAGVRPWWTPNEHPELFAYTYLTGMVPNDSRVTYPVDFARARRFSQRACEQGSSFGCEYLVRIYQEGLGTPKDDAQALRILALRCERGDSQACHRQGEMLAIDPTDTKAVDLFEKACTSPRQRVWAACVSLAEYYRVGRGRPKDPVRARTLVQEACDVGYQDGCAGTVFIDAWNAPAGPARDACIEKLRAMCAASEEDGALPCGFLHAAEQWPADGGGG